MKEIYLKVYPKTIEVLNILGDSYNVIIDSARQLSVDNVIPQEWNKKVTKNQMTSKHKVKGIEKISYNHQSCF